MNTEQLDMLVAFVALTSSEEVVFNKDTGNLPIGIKDLEDGPTKSAWKSAVKCYSDTPMEDLVKAVGDLVWSMPDYPQCDGLFDFVKEMGVPPLGQFCLRNIRMRMMGALRQHQHCFEPDYFRTKEGGEVCEAFDAHESSEEEVMEETTTTTKGTKSMSIKEMFAGDLNVADSVLKGLTDGNLTMAYLEGQYNRASKVDGLESEVKELKVIAASRPKTVLPTKFESVSGSELVGQLEWLKASDIFDLKGTAKSYMSFDVPVWTWKDKDGEVVEHPEVPTVDGHYKFDGRLFEAIRAVMNKDFLWIWGHTGAGKSSLIEQIAARLKFPLVTVSMDGEITRMDLIGQTKLTEKSGVTVTEFIEGVLPNAMQRPSILLMDEMDFVRGDVAYALQTVLNSKSGTLNLLEDGGRVVHRHPWSMIVATANTNGRGDESGRYNYAKRQSSALLNRFTSWMKADYLSKRDEVSLLKRVVPELTTEEVDQLCNYAKEHRAAFLKDDIEMAMSLRNLVALGQKYIDYKVFLNDDKASMTLAFENTITNAASEDDAVAINGIRQRVIGA
tara:strand:+ start:679 stop:2352 length:1674 start_codon:yes stop_codon:yes gene_type:complete